MLRRRYPRRHKNVDQSAPVKSVRLSPEAAQVLERLTEAMVEKWSPEELPSVSMLISKALVFYADRITYDPRKLEATYQEFVDESRTREDERNKHT
ncbi:MAG: hypothetical protein E6K65_08000 [Nitrospirae bacterium]|nr:MAG: hypothetical protein E6K65_08000 [Nitrospirota bacterium]